MLIGTENSFFFKNIVKRNSVLDSSKKASYRFHVLGKDRVWVRDQPCDTTLGRRLPTGDKPVFHMPASAAVHACVWGTLEAFSFPQRENMR